MKTLALTLTLIGGLSAPVMAEPIVLTDSALDQCVAGGVPGPVAPAFGHHGPVAPTFGHHGPTAPRPGTPGPTAP